MVKIANGFGLPTVFVRYSPNRYRPANSNVIVHGNNHDERMALLSNVLEEVRAISSIARDVINGRGHCVALRLYFDQWDPAYHPTHAAVVTSNPEEIASTGVKRKIGAATILPPSAAPKLLPNTASKCLDGQLLLITSFRDLTIEAYMKACGGNVTAMWRRSRSCCAQMGAAAAT